MRNAVAGLALLFVFGGRLYAFAGCEAVSGERIALPELAPASAARFSEVALPLGTAETKSGVLWPARELGQPSDASLAYPPSSPRHYQELESGELLALLELEAEWVDARGQRLERGAYTLRYVVQPRMKDHFGTAPRSDFALLVSLADDSGAEISGDEAIESSRKAAGGHPRVFPLVPVPAGVEAPALCSTPEGTLVVFEIGGREVALVFGAPAEGRGEPR